MATGDRASSDGPGSGYLVDAFYRDGFVSPGRCPLSVTVGNAVDSAGRPCLAAGASSRARHGRLLGTSAFSALPAQSADLTPASHPGYAPPAVRFARPDQAAPK